ncbi:DUF6448 family protein [uncultured Ilyobacter sp.]|uniref:DUF6448 family protein n=1 Tax=uncultured Ilyobacter sp. TaxID=544433 RepID=UPI0029F4DD1F|nr:DUF6448 family protein [uncultured Ilyobacter sp.]
MKKIFSRTILMGTMIFAVITLNSKVAEAHCDSVDGPVVSAAKKALNSKDVKLVLPYVNEDGEHEVEDAFKKVLLIRNKGIEEKEVADRYFYETVVRVHRKGEGAAFEGLKPAGTDYGPALKTAEDALEKRSDKYLKKLLRKHLDEAIEDRFKETMEIIKLESKNDSVAAKRKIVEAEFEFEKYILGIANSIQGTEHNEGEHKH